MISKHKVWVNRNNCYEINCKLKLTELLPTV